MDTYLDNDDIDNVISFEYVRATRTLEEVKRRNKERWRSERKWAIEQRNARDRMDRNNRILQQLGLGPKRRQ